MWLISIVVTIVVIVRLVPVVVVVAVPIVIAVVRATPSNIIDLPLLTANLFLLSA